MSAQRYVTVACQTQTCEHTLELHSSRFQLHQIQELLLTAILP
jgi:hypothetical protein